MIALLCEAAETTSLAVVLMPAAALVLGFGVLAFAVLRGR